jgi:class 3 adenylate cyclase
MADEGFQRIVAAILTADVEGYSRLMDDDEETAIRTLKSYRAAINDLVQQYRGRISEIFGVDYSTVSQNRARLKTKLKSNRKLKKQFDRILNQKHCQPEPCTSEN